MILFLQGLLFACSKKEVQKVEYPAHKVLILGNSITYAPANPSIDWNGSWGMAASVADSDYVHLITSRFKALNNSTTVDAVNIAEFEREFDTYNFDKLKAYRDAKPDIIILRIGENFLRESEAGLFEAKYVELLNYLKINNPQVKILAVGSFWTLRDVANAVMSKYTNYISLSSLESVESNMAFGLYSDLGVQLHPSNKGMKAISDMIWAEMVKNKFL
ncbi:MAG: SGNH/GDSL hydrolase family protein [Sphingobacteriaceae bacterium]|nr:MAG: SGNH/GDSL hydrolase family protein [Sphingobacteriaceae bacterium]